MPADHLVSRGGRHILQREQSLLLGYDSVIHDLQKQVPQLLFEIFGIARLVEYVDPADDLRGLLDAGRLQTGSAPGPRDSRPAPAASPQPISICRSHS